MKLETWQRDRNERCMERHQLSIERLQMIDQEETVHGQVIGRISGCVAAFCSNWNHFAEQ